MSVSSLTELHTPQQILSFSIVSNEQLLLKWVTILNPVFQPILTAKIVPVNMGWNTGFSLVTALNKCCSLLTVLKPNVWQGVCSSVRLDTDIFIGTSVLNCTTAHTAHTTALLHYTFYPNSIIQNNFLKKIGWYTFFFPLRVGKIWAYMVGYYYPNCDFGCQLAYCHCKVLHNAH